jgi:hypothetical protein
MRLLVVALAACGHAAPPAPSPPIPAVATDNPCFAGKPPIKASEMYTALEKYAWSLYQSEAEPPPPPTTYGSCKVDRNKVTSADGALVAELGCGVRVVKRGIVDGLGLQLGARGQDVIDRKRATTPLSCFANGPDTVRCRWERADGSDTDDDWYVVAGSLGEDPLTGEPALAYFRSRTIVELDVSVWCH